MTRRGWLRLMAAGVLVVWLCLFLHWDNTEKSMIRALLVETSGDGWTVGLPGSLRRFLRGQSRYPSLYGPRPRAFFCHFCR